MAMRAINRGKLNSEELTEGLTEISIAEKTAQKPIPEKLEFSI